ncbi:chemotaxis protein CheW [Acidiferrimicrobium sp. IK]|uniref:chemotaxis protein CheW n=1 Tax=Acidiferrimicrobium sp. IK TaxID=2871700 RepID=UPI0021CB1C63|nr:chemotaxis protein CheW [Acidiferrimicrobium sp. IK]MCU4182819.1 chemotaxis protein CheW [Acidiferrimicrobium sp. IK]
MTATTVLSTDIHQYCTMFVGDLALGVEIGLVQEIVRHMDMTPVPLSPPAVVGLINLRGQIVTAIDLRRRLGLEPAPEGHQPVHVVIRIDGRAVSVLADRIGDVVTTTAPADAVPDTLAPEVRHLVAGVHQLDDRLLLKLDAAAAIDSARLWAAPRDEQ